MGMLREGYTTRHNPGVGIMAQDMGGNLLCDAGAV